MSNTKIIATIAYVIFFLLGLIWGFMKGNSEESRLNYVAERITVETNENKNVSLVYHCSNNSFATYDVDQNTLLFDPSSFSVLSSINSSDSENPFTLSTFSTLMGGAFGGWTIKDLYRYSKASKTKIFFQKSVTIIISAITGFGVGYALAIIIKNKTRRCDSEIIVKSLESKDFWFKLEEMIFRNAIYNISINNEGAKKAYLLHFRMK